MIVDSYISLKEVILPEELKSLFLALHNQFKAIIFIRVYIVLFFHFAFGEFFMGQSKREIIPQTNKFKLLMSILHRIVSVLAHLISE